MATDAAILGYCRRCSYPLLTATAGRCPECGRPFDAGRRKTFDQSPRRRVARRILKWSIPLLILPMIAGSPIIWVYAGWRAERVAEARAGKHLDVRRRKIIGPPWAAKLLGQHAYWLDRDSDIVMLAPGGDPSWKLLSSFRYVVELVAFGDRTNRRPSDDDLAGIKEMSGLEAIQLTDLDCTDATLTAMTSMPHLKRVELEHLPAITDAGMSALSGATELRMIHLRYLPIGDEGIRRLNLESKADLADVDLHGGTATDVSVRAITGRPRLRMLSVCDLPLTDNALIGINRAKELHCLTFDSTQLTGATFPQLDGLKAIEQASFTDSKITNDGILKFPHLPGCPYLNVAGTSVTPEGAKRFRDSHHDAILCTTIMMP